MQAAHNFGKGGEAAVWAGTGWVFSLAREAGCWQMAETESRVSRKAKANRL
jgi:hypothetical protein